MLVSDTDSFTAGGQNLHRRRAPRGSLDQIGGASTTCSQLSNTNSRDPALQRGGHRLADALARLLGDAQHRRHRIGHRSRISDRRQLENPDTVEKFVGQLRRDFQRQPGLADSTHARSMSPTDASAAPLADSATSDVAPDEARDRRPQVSRIRSTPRNGGNSVRRPGARTWNTPTGADTSRNRRGPRSSRSTPLSRPAVESATRI